jgi:integrase/recombinase XerD
MKVKDTFQKYLEYLETIGAAKNTIKNDKTFLLGTLSHSIQDMDIESLKPADVAKVIAAGKSHGHYGAQRSVVVLRKLLKFVKESGHPISLKWRDLSIPGVPQKENEYLTEQELEALLNAIDLATPAGLRTRVLLEVLYATGMRIGEAISMDRSDVDWENKEALITNVKTKAKEKVYFTDRSLEWLKRYVNSRKDKNPALFISGRERMVRASSGGYIRTHLKQLADKLGIRKKIKHHLFRKTYVTHLLQHKADIIAVRDLARHKSEQTTLENYAAFDDELAKEAHDRTMRRMFGGRME